MGSCAVSQQAQAGAGCPEPHAKPAECQAGAKGGFLNSVSLDDLAGANLAPYGLIGLGFGWP